MYAEIALNVPVHGTFHYHIPDELAGQVEVGQLVQVAFRTAQQHGIVIDLPAESDVPKTKPVLGILDPHPVVTPDQIAIARWISQHNLMALGPCLWLFLPPGLTGRRDIQVTLLIADADHLSELEEQIVAVLQRRGPLTGHQLNLALPGQDWRSAVDGLAKAGIVHKANILTPPRARPKLVRTAALAIHPQQIDHVARHLGRASKQADLLEVIAAAGEDGLPVERALRIAETARDTLRKLEAAGSVATNQNDRTADEPLRVWLTLPREAVDENLIMLRKGERLHHILRVLARENDALDVSWLYAQTDAKLADLKKLEEEGLVLLGESESWRDSLAQREFVPSLAPPLTPEQQAIWEVLEARLKAWDWENEVKTIPPNPTPAPLPEFREGKDSASAPPPPSPRDAPQNSGEVGRGFPEAQEAQTENYRTWRAPAHLWRFLKPLAAQMRHEPTQTEERMWSRLRKKQLGHKFRRQHPIERFIVDFYAPDAGLVVEIDGEIHQYTPEEEAVRQTFLESQGLRVLRFSNTQVMADVEGVLATIERALQDSLPASLGLRLELLTQQTPHEPTPVENYLWGRLRKAPFEDLFHHQHPIERFIVDFLAPDAGLVVEIDGEMQQYTLEEAAIRQAFLESQGLRVLRFPNTQIMADVDGVLEIIEAALAEEAPPSPAVVEERQADTPQDQDEAANDIFLLHGVTGSGKTEIYLRAIDLTLAQGRQALFLVPEIALTPQTIRRVAARFPGQVGVIHGSLSEGERYDTWRRAREGLLGVVVGARSALFTPFPDLGLIILDEAHDHSYKQGAGSLHPYYHAREVAEQMMRRNRGVLILGSATPDLETYFRAQRGDLKLLHLPNRIMGHRTHILEQSEREGVHDTRYYPARAEDAVMIDLPPVQVVDMRAELKSGNTGMFSRALEEALASVLDRHEQAMLFLNRRGANTYVFCRDCGYVALCPNCDLPATYHSHDDSLRCHLCGYRARPPQVCPACQSRRIKYFGAGTQQVEQELIRRFPLVRVLRWDADTARTPGAHEDLLQRFIDRKADVLIGTQMVAKGLDLPLVTLVGMVSADVGLNLPDFRAGERTFQLLTQVAGRAGRGLRGGRAILQTYQPEHYVIEAAAAQDYDRFYRREIAYRRELGYPPFRRLARVVFQHAQETKVRAEAEQAAAQIRHRIATLNLTGTEMIGPAPCFFGKIDNIYRWHLLLRSPDPTLALEGFDLPATWQVDIDPVSVL